MNVTLKNTGDSHSEAVIVPAPQGAIEKLVEAALSAHLAPAPRERVTEVSLSTEPDAACIYLSSTIPDQSRSGLDREWLAFTQRLCTILGYEHQTITDTEDRIDTRIILPQETKGTHYDR